jgi:transposase-like protein
VGAAVHPAVRRRLSPAAARDGDRWFVDETYVKIAGRWQYLYRAVDQFGQVIDVLLVEQRDTAAARRFFIRALRHGPAPVEVTTDKAGPYPRVLDELVPTALHMTEQYVTQRIEIRPLIRWSTAPHLVRRWSTGSCRGARSVLGGRPSDRHEPTRGGTATRR